MRNEIEADGFITPDRYMVKDVQKGGIMTKVEAIKTLEMAKAEVEWNYPMDYQIALDMAIEALKKEVM